MEVLEARPSQNPLQLASVSLGGISVSPLGAPLHTGKPRRCVPFLQTDFHPKSPSGGTFQSCSCRALPHSSRNLSVILRGHLVLVMGDGTARSSRGWAVEPELAGSSAR